MNAGIEQRARELLAAEVEAAGRKLSARAIVHGGIVSVEIEEALSAIAAALQAQQPGAQAVGYVSPSVVEHLRNGGHACTTITAHQAMPDDVALYTGPQPPSIPEPNHDDIAAALDAYMAKMRDDRSLWASIEAALTAYTARLLERIGGGG